ncbi:LysR family transcriptional regulator [Bordetella flabilis]|uniref:LysR family transcriptional regulator n=1 Tax=Bordetella flabilis TaxID=463014 RepID=A0A193GFI7_9BORD|nr:LysR family transcriptional regulator [Bordetella flabilis]ANN78363.1 LysR family transcriptional regulator [Bordetella flabilis]
MLDSLSLNQIRIFVAVADSGSFRAAGTRLRRAQSAVSHAIAALESELGVTLFDRSARTPVLTQAGRTLLEDARSLLMRVDFLRARAHGLGQDVELEISIVVDTLFPMPTLCAALKDWHAAMPSVQLRLSVGALGTPLDALLAGRCAMAIMVGEDFPDSRVEREALTTIDFVAVIAPSHPLAQAVGHGLKPRAADLADYLQIVQTDPSPLSADRDFGVISPQTWRVGEQDTKLALIRAGLGWGRMPLWAVETDLAEGRLLRLPVQALGPQGGNVVQAYLAHRQDAARGPAAAALRAHLVRHLAQGPTRGTARRPAGRPQP